MTKRAANIFAVVAGVGLSLSLAADIGSANSRQPPDAAQVTTQGTPAPESMPAAAQIALVHQYCAKCHNDADVTGDLSLEHFNGSEQAAPALAAAMARRLKAGEMPPAGEPRPDEATVKSFIAALQVAAIPGMASAAAASATATQVIAFPHTGNNMPETAQNAMVHQVCTQCHTDKRKPGGLSFEHFDMASAPANAKIAEDMIAKLRAGMMPPRTAPKRPDEASIQAFIVSLENRLDRAAALQVNPGQRTFQRLNRVEYTNSIAAMLGIHVDVTQWLPPDTMSHNFDNIAEAQGFSPTLLQSYLTAADAVSRLAVGDPGVTTTSVTYPVDPFASQMDHVDGAPMGTRGGISTVHIFPADGKYRFKLVLYDTPLGDLFGLTTVGEQIEVSINNEPVALLDVDPRMNEDRPEGLTIATPPIDVKAGPQRVSAAFIQRSNGPIDDLVKPIEFTLADTNIGSAQGVTSLPHLRDLSISGPFSVTGVSDTISRQRIFVCRPASAADEMPCVRKILTNLAGQAYRRPATAEDLKPLMTFYEQGRNGHDFESGVRMALQAILASPDFLFRLEPQPAATRAAQNYRVDDLGLASRLSYFLWALPPDAELRKVAAEGRLHEPAVLDAQLQRMLTDPRSIALSTRFESLWLRLQDVDKVHPDPLVYPNYDKTLADAMKRETQLLFDSIVKEDRNVLDLLTADYTFVNERLAAFYGIPGIAGSQFRRVSLAGTHRQGVLGHGSILVETSVADRTSPVQRGKWVLEVLLGQPPPPPPPNIPTLDETSAVSGGKTLSVRGRMEEHRKNPFCASCHKTIDPIGLALENFDPTGHWRVHDFGRFDSDGVPIDAAGELYDGNRIDGLEGLNQSLLKHKDTVIRVFAENLMAYAIGRPVQYYDMPTIRAMVNKAASNGNRFSTFVVGIVNSPAFRMRHAEAEVLTDSQSDRQ